MQCKIVYCIVNTQSMHWKNNTVHAVSIYVQYKNQCELVWAVGKDLETWVTKNNMTPSSHRKWQQPYWILTLGYHSYSNRFMSLHVHYSLTNTTWQLHKGLKTITFTFRKFFANISFCTFSAGKHEFCTSCWRSILKNVKVTGARGKAFYVFMWGIPS